MSIQELLKPRYLVIADYPKSIYDVGTIIRADGRSEDLLYCDHSGPRCRDYPHLFRKLEWWEERKPEDMPKYVKDRFGKMYKTVSIDWKYMSVILDDDPGPRAFVHFLPATEEEYLASLSPQSNVK